MDINAYFKTLEKEVKKAYLIAEEARKKRLDPEDHVEIPISADMADRVQNLVSIINPIVKEINLPEAIRKLEKEYGSLTFKTILKIADYVSDKIYEKTKDKRLAIDLGLRVAFAYQTLGVVAAPTEGIVKVEEKDRLDGKGKYIAVYYAGPVRSAGGTPTAFSVVVADFLRRKYGYLEWDPSEEELQRYIIEIYDYNRVKHLQYVPYKEELMFLLKHLPIEVTGESTEKEEVSAYKGLKRIETDRIRGGMALVIAEGLCQKAKKIWKKLKSFAGEMNLEDWRWLEDYLKLQEDLKAGNKTSKKENKNEEKRKEEKNNEEEQEKIKKENIDINNTDLKKQKIKSYKEYIEEKIKPNWAYLKEIAAGRAVFGLPMQKGGFRLRYGKSRWNGHDTASIHPAAGILVLEYISVGTQLRIERPGKSAGITYADTIEPPVVKLKDGSVIKVKDYRLAKKILKNIDKILFLGDFLVPFGDFVDAGHPIIPSGYCEEWWVLEVDKAAKEIVDGYNIEFSMFKPRTLFNIENLDKLSKFLNISENRLKKLILEPLKYKPTLKEAIIFSKKLKVPLHPEYIFFWRDISADDFIKLYNKISSVIKDKIFNTKEILKVNLRLKLDEDIKRILEDLLIPHIVKDNKFIIIKTPYAGALLLQLGFYESKKDLYKEIENIDISNLTGLELVNKTSPFIIKDKAGISIGTRLGRPEKAKMREISGSPSGLFPVGLEGGRMRNFMETLNNNKIKAEVSIFICPKCNRETIYPFCEKCNTKTEKYYICRVCGQKTKLKEHCGKPTKETIIKILNPQEFLTNAISYLGISPSEVPHVVKGVKGLINKEKIPERLEKAILRAKNNVTVFKDGTIRFDSIEIPVLYFKPKDLKYVTIDKLKELGYTHDIYGNPLESEDQILELKPQDVILPSMGPIRKNKKLTKDGFATAILNAAKFIDDELELFYKLKRFYNAKTPEDLIGHLVILLAPHTSAGIIGRIIGFAEVQALLAHPLVHAAMRRNCDGDEACVILLLDALLNFSRRYLPSKRGGTMDAPLTVTLKAVPTEVDDEVHNFDVVWNYPLEFYEASEKIVEPDQINIPLLKSRLGTEAQYYNWGFMHDIESFNVGNKVSSYKRLKTMLDKLNAQLKVAEICRSTDKNKVGELVVNLHLLKDIRGNLRKFSSQTFRCAKCNTKYRRMPLSGKCEKCGNKLIFTVSKGFVTKYLDFSLWLAEELDFDDYIKSSVKVIKLRAEQTLGKINKKNDSLEKWLKPTKN